MGPFHYVLSCKANQGAFQTGDYEEIMNKATCLSLLSNAALVWNTVQMSRIIEQLRASGETIGSVHMTQVLPQVSCYALCGVIQHPLPEEIQLHPSIPAPLDQLQAVDVTFDRPVRPGER